MLFATHQRYNLNKAGLFGRSVTSFAIACLGEIKGHEELPAAFSLADIINQIESMPQCLLQYRSGLSFDLAERSVRPCTYS